MGNKTVRIIRFSWIIVALSGLMLSSCEKDVPAGPANLRVRLSATMDGTPFELNKVFTGPEGMRMTVEEFRFYLSEFSLFGSSGKASIRDLALIDFTNGKTDFEMEIPPGTYSNLTFAVGVPASLNGIGDSTFNPAKYPKGHPLNLQNNMYWTSSTGYVFLRIEGKLDTSLTQDKPMLYPWFYHSGTNALYEYRSMGNLNLKINGSEPAELKLNLELNDIFRFQADTIRMKQEQFTHTTDHFELASRILRNLRMAIRQQ